MYHACLQTDYGNNDVTVKVLVSHSRVIIGGLGVDATSDALKELRAVIYQPQANCTDLSDWDCTLSTLRALGDANTDSTLYELGETDQPSPWMILRVSGREMVWAGRGGRHVGGCVREKGSGWTFNRVHNRSAHNSLLSHIQCSSTLFSVSIQRD